LRAATTLPSAGVQRKASVVIVGAGIAGLAAAWALARQGIDDIALLELEDSSGGNSRGHRLAGLACPMGAHYLPLPTPDAHEVSQWLHEIGLLKHTLGRTVADERHLCHSPQERLFFDGTWHEGLLPPAEPGSTTAAQYSRYAQAVRRLQGQRVRHFALPASRAQPSAEVLTLDTLTFSQWLDQQGLNDPQLRWYLDYCCRDDYGAAANSVSAWAGIHYFASRHGFQAPGEEGSGERDAVFTWPEGNAWLVQRLAAPLQDRLHSGRSVLRVSEQRHGVQLLVWNEAQQQAENWQAQTVVMALPLFVAARVLDAPPTALTQAAQLPRAPWLVANVHIDRPLLDRPGAAPSWDSVAYSDTSADTVSTGLGYVDAMHQSLRSAPGPTVLTAYHVLPLQQRTTLLSHSAEHWRDHVLQNLARTHPDIHHRAQQVHLARWAHAMAVPVPGVLRSSALQALRTSRGRVRYAHADLAGYSIFEEAFTAGCLAARWP
jgi:protoporphyrinogen oxidase